MEKTSTSPSFAPVHDAVLCAVCLFEIDDAGVILSAIGGDKSAQLDDDFTFGRERGEKSGKLLQIVLGCIPRKVRDAQPGAVFHAADAGKFSAQLLEHLHFPAHRLDALLCTRIVLDALDFYGQIFPFEKGAEGAFVHAELISAGQAQQDGKARSAFRGKAAEQGKLGNGFRRVRGARSAGGQGAAHVLFRFINAGKHQFLCGNTQFFADLVPPRGTHFQIIRKGRRFPDEKGICLDGIAKLCPAQRAAAYTLAAVARKKANRYVLTITQNSALKNRSTVQRRRLGKR